MSKHTPGPWKVQHECGRHYSIRKDGYWIGRCKGAENAQLIAAVTELLDALRVIEVFMGADFDDLPIASKARAAIAKATGETK